MKTLVTGHISIVDNQQHLIVFYLLSNKSLSKLLFINKQQKNYYGNYVEKFSSGGNRNNEKCRF